MACETGSSVRVFDAGGFGLDGFSDFCATVRWADQQ